MTKQQIKKFFGTLREANPNPTTELNFTSPFELLIAVLLSAQSTDKAVNLATAQLFAEANNPKAMLELGEEGVKNFIRTIGLFNNKAKHIVQTCQLLLERHQGEVPDQREDLEALPGVGRKTANVILNTAFRQPTMAVDTHIFRVSNRTGLAPGKTPLAVEKGLLAAIPEAFLLDAHHWLILHGRYTCMARSPKCPTCSVAKFCDFPDKTLE